MLICLKTRTKLQHGQTVKLVEPCDCGCNGQFEWAAVILSCPCGCGANVIMTTNSLNHVPGRRETANNKTVFQIQTWPNE